MPQCEVLQLKLTFRFEWRGQAWSWAITHNAHVDRSDGLSVIAKERFPTLRWRLTTSDHVFRDRLDRATSNPSFKSSPWIRDAPQSGFSVLIRRLSSRSSRSIEIQRNANEELFQAERHGQRQAGSATIGTCKPATPCHCLGAADGTAPSVMPSSIDDGETGSRFQADYAT